MRLAIFGVALALGFCTPAAAEDTCGPLKLAAAVDMIPDSYGRMTIPVGLAGQPRRLVVDTGAAISSLDDATVTALGLERLHTMVAVRDILGNTSEYLTRVPQFSIGRMKADSVKFFIMPKPQADRASPDTPAADPDADVAGLFGADFLRPYDVDLDFGAKKFRLISQDHCPGKVLYWHPANYSAIPFRIDDDGNIVMPMTLDGQRITALLDTGADSTTMNGDIAKHLFGLNAGGDSDPAVINGEKVSGVYEHRFKSLEIEGLAISNPTISIVPNIRYSKMGVEESWYWRTHGGDNDYQLIVGMRTLKALHIYVAYKEKVLYISPAADRDDAPQPEAASAH